MVRADSVWVVAICAPADVVKSRVMGSKGGQGIPSIIMTAVKTEGVSFFFRGWTAAWWVPLLSSAPASPFDVEFGWGWVESGWSGELMYVGS